MPYTQIWSAPRPALLSGGFSSGQMSNTAGVWMGFSSSGCQARIDTPTGVVLGPVFTSPYAFAGGYGKSRVGTFGDDIFLFTFFANDVSTNRRMGALRVAADGTITLASDVALPAFPSGFQQHNYSVHEDGTVRLAYRNTGTMRLQRFVSSVNASGIIGAFTYVGEEALPADWLRSQGGAFLLDAEDGRQIRLGTSPYVVNADGTDTAITWENPLPAGVTGSAVIGTDNGYLDPVRYPGQFLAYVWVSGDDREWMVHYSIEGGTASLVSPPYEMHNNYVLPDGTEIADYELFWPDSTGKAAILYITQDAEWNVTGNRLIYDTFGTPATENITGDDNNYLTTAYLSVVGDDLIHVSRLVDGVWYETLASLQGPPEPEPEPEPEYDWSQGHAYLPQLDALGQVRRAADVQVAQHGTFPLPLYGHRNSTTPLRNPFPIQPVLLDLWADAPLRVDLGIILGGAEGSYSLRGVDLYCDPREMVVAKAGFEITSAQPPTEHHILRATGDDTAEWYDYEADISEVVGTATATVGFFGQPGVTKQTVTDGGEHEAVTALLQAFEAMGLLDVQ